MTVVYKGRKYKCKLKTAIKIYALQTNLIIQRQKRRIKIVLHWSDIVLYFGVLLLWLLFEFVMQQVDLRFFQGDTSYLDVLWKDRNSIFSSVVLAFFVASYRRIEVYKKKIKHQHYVYVDALDTFEGIPSLFLDVKYINHFRPFYSDSCKMLVDKAMEEKQLCKNNEVKLCLMFEMIKEKLKSIHEDLKRENLIIEDEEMFFYELDDTNKILRICMEMPNNDEIIKLCERLYSLLENIRYPWRRDQGVDIQIILLLRREHNMQIEYDFYKRMLLPDFGFKMMNDSI